MAKNGMLMDGRPSAKLIPPKSRLHPRSYLQYSGRLENDHTLSRYSHSPPSLPANRFYRRRRDGLQQPVSEWRLLRQQQQLGLAFSKVVQYPALNLLHPAPQSPVQQCPASPSAAFCSTGDRLSAHAATPATLRSPLQPSSQHC